MSCDYILPPMFGDFFSLASMRSLLYDLLPSMVVNYEDLLGTADKFLNVPADEVTSRVVAFGYKSAHCAC